MQDFIIKHQKAVMITGLLLAVGFLIFIIATSSNNTSEAPAQSETDGGVDGPEEMISIPYSNTLYTIDFSPKNIDGVPESNNLVIKAYPGYRTAAINKIGEFGYDTADYKITFNNYENPFDAYK